MNILSFLAFLFVCLWGAYAQTALQFTADGLLDTATTSGDEFNSGGSMTVNGYTITVPKNFMVEFPARWVPWKDFAAGSFTGLEVREQRTQFVEATRRITNALAGERLRQHRGWQAHSRNDADRSEPPHVRHRVC